MNELAPLLKLALAPTALAALGGIVLSFVVDFWPAYEKLSPKRKRMAFFLACFVVSALIYALLAAMGVFTWDINLLWLTLAAWFAAITTGTGAHTRELPDK